jgi:hypothetical protein
VEVSQGLCRAEMNERADALARAGMAPFKPGR